MPSSAALGHPVSPDTRRSGDVRALDIDSAAMRVALGRVIARTFELVGPTPETDWSSHKEAAARLDVDEGELGKWLSGARRPHLDKLLAIPELQQALIVALAELGGIGVEVVTEIRLRRTAPALTGRRQLRMGLKP